MGLALWRPAGVQAFGYYEREGNEIRIGNRYSGVTHFNAIAMIVLPASAIPTPIQEEFTGIIRILMASVAAASEVIKVS